VNGPVYAQPLVAGSTVIVATENNWVYGLNAQTGQVNWSEQVGTPFQTSQVGCMDLGPASGVTSTGVYDPASGTVYLVADTVPQGNSPNQPVFDLFGLNAQTGQITLTVPIQGAAVNAPSRTFSAFSQLQRPALLLQNGVVYAAFGSYCDFLPYLGYVAAVNVGTKGVTLWSDEAGVTDDRGGIWQSGGGLMSDGPNRVFFTSGNGVSPAPGPGGSPPPELSESVVRLAVQPGGPGVPAALTPQDFFSPANAPTLDAFDQDLGSAGPVGLPVGTVTYPHLLVQAGKEGKVFVLNRDNLGGREQGPGGTDAFLAEVGRFGGIWGHPAVFESSTSPLHPGSASLNDYVYYLGKNDNLRALQLGANASGLPTLTDVANSTTIFGFSSGSPVVTSNGTDAASAVVWVVGANDGTGAGGTLYAFDAVPQQVSGSLQLKQIWAAPIGTASKFCIPATSGGRVYVATRDGHVLGFGSPDAAPLTGASPLSFQAAVGGPPQTRTASVAATAAVSVSQPALSATGQTDPFSLGQATVTPSGGSPSPVSSFPVTLNPGDTLSVPVTFGPPAPGPVTGFVTFASTSPDGTVTYPPVNTSLSAEGTQDGLFASPGSLTFGSNPPVPVGTNVPLTMDIVNYGTTSASVTSVSPPSAPFTATGLPSPGATIAPGQSVPVTVTYTPKAPTTAGPDQGSFTIDGSTGNVTVGLAGNAVAGVSSMTASPATVNFGSVPLGQQATITVGISNTGNLPATVTSTSTPDSPFGTPTPVAAGLPVNPRYDLQIPVTFTPSSIGSISWTYQFTWTDAQGTHTVTVPVAGTGTAPAAGAAAIAPPGGGWTLNGQARMSGSSLLLTPVAANAAGSAIYPVPVPSDGLSAQFTAQIGGGTGGDGMTFSLLDPAASSTRSLGHRDWGLGYGGLSGVAVVLDTHQSTGDPSSNFIGIATGATSNSLIFAQTNSQIPNLRTGSHTVGVSVSGGTIKVTLDGTQYLSAAVNLPPQVLVGFTGSTGSLTDAHTVSNTAITAGGNPVPPPGGGWSFNVTAGMSFSDTELTPTVTNKAGSVVYPTAVPTAGLKVEFNIQLTGGDGLTSALLDPGTESATACGGTGGDLGFGGLNGLAVTFATRKDTGFPAWNFAGISTGTNSTGQDLVFQVVARAIPPLRQGTHTVEVNVTTSGVLIVFLDGAQIFQQAEPSLPASALLAFTGATGLKAGTHLVRDVAISTAG
jgi:outer membrane protein assembly factor BamB